MGKWMITIVKNVCLSIPVLICWKDRVGYLATIEGFSMQPTLNANPKHSSDVVWVSTWKGSRRKPRVGEIVVSRSPECFGECIVKRVVAVEGDIVRKRHHDSYIEIPENHVWLEGDNPRSHDSNDYGPVSAGLVFGRVRYVLLPLQRQRQLSSKLLKQQLERVL